MILCAISFKMTFISKINWIKFIFNEKIFVLFELMFLLRLTILLSKSAFVTKFACANLPAKFSAVKFWGSNIFIMIIISNFHFNFFNFYVMIYFFLTKLLTLAILFSTAVSAEFVTKPVILGILLSISAVLAL